MVFTLSQQFSLVPGSRAVVLETVFIGTTVVLWTAFVIGSVVLETVVLGANFQGLIIS